MVHDGFGSASHIGQVGDWMRGQGIEVAVFRPETSWNKLRRSRLRRLHHKLAMVDGRIAFVGGINIIDDLNMPEPRSPRFDYAVLWKARCWNPFTKAMCELWSRLHQHGIDHLRAAIAAFPPVANAVGDHHARFAFRDNVQHRRDIEREYLTAILAAKATS